MSANRDAVVQTQSSHPLLSCTDGFANQAQDMVLLLGRVMLGWIFMQSGWSKLQNIPGFAAAMSQRGVPEVLGWIAPPVEFIGGLAILIGLSTRYAALAMFLFTIVATFTSHAYWNYPPAQQPAQATQFWKNVSIMGGQLLLFVTAGGRISLDWLLRRK